VRPYGEGPMVSHRALIQFISRPVSRVLYGPPEGERDGHSSATPLARRLKQPTRTADPDRSGSLSSRKRGLRAAPFLFGLAPGGVCRAVGVAADAVRSYRTFSPLPANRRFVLCGTFPGLAPAGRYPAPFVHGARTFLPGHLSVIAGAAVQPTDGIGMGSGTRQVKAGQEPP
jgi:hypothetical protein